MTAQPIRRAAHHRSGPSYGGTPGRAAQVAAIIERAGPGGISKRALLEALGMNTGGSAEAVLATATPRYPQICEADDGRLVWVPREAVDTGDGGRLWLPWVDRDNDSPMGQGVSG